MCLLMQRLLTISLLQNDTWPWTHTHTHARAHTTDFSLKKQFSLFALFCLKCYLILFSSSPFPGQSQNAEYLERKKGKLADRLPIFFTSFRDLLFFPRPTKEDSF